MGLWTYCNDEYIPADVIRFREGIWQRRGPAKRSKGFKVGDREVVAEVLHEDDEWVWLKVIECKLLGDDGNGRKASGLKKNDEIPRARKTIARGWPQRMRWSDEGARAVLVSERAPKPAEKPARKKKPKG